MISETWPRGISRPASSLPKYAETHHISMEQIFASVSKEKVQKTLILLSISHFFTALYKQVWWLHANLPFLWNFSNGNLMFVWSRRMELVRTFFLSFNLIKTPFNYKVLTYNTYLQCMVLTLLTELYSTYNTKLAILTYNEILTLLTVLWFTLYIYTKQKQLLALLTIRITYATKTKKNKKTYM